MFDLEKSSRTKNPDVAHGKVTLGRRTFTSKNMLGTGAKYARVAIEGGDTRSGIYTFMSGHSTGKTVLVKRLYAGWHLCEPERPGIIFDMQGKDHRLSKFPSEYGFLFTDIGEYRWGFGERQINLTPSFLKKDTFDLRFPGEQYFALPWTDLRNSEWFFLLVELSGSMAISWVQSFIFILNQVRGKITSFKQLIAMIEEEAYKANAARKSDPNEFVPLHISTAELKNMVKALSIIRDRKFVVDPTDPLAENQPLDLLKAGKIVNISFYNKETVEVQTYVGVILRRIYEHYDELDDLMRVQGQLSTSPWIVIEEFNKLVPVKQQAGAESPALSVTREIINQGMKCGFKFALIFQDGQNIDAKLRRSLLSDTVFVCNLNVSDMKMLMDKEGTQVKPLLQSLDLEWDEYMSKEWAMFRNSIAWTFRPAASPMQFHERFKRG